MATIMRRAVSTTVGVAAKVHTCSYSARIGLLHHSCLCGEPTVNACRTGGARSTPNTFLTQRLDQGSGDLNLHQRGEGELMQLGAGRASTAGIATVHVILTSAKQTAVTAITVVLVVAHSLCENFSVFSWLKQLSIMERGCLGK